MAVPLCRGDQSSLVTAPEICDGAARLQVARGSAGGPGRWRTEAPAAKALCSSAPAAGGVLGRALSPLGPAVLVPLPYGDPWPTTGRAAQWPRTTDAATTRASGRGGRAQAHRGCCGRRVPAGASPPLTVCCLVASRPGRGRRRGQRLGRSRHPAPPARSACVPSWPPTGCATGSRHGEQGGGAFLADSH